MPAKLSQDTEERIHEIARSLNISYVDAFRKIVSIGVFAYETRNLIIKIKESNDDKQQEMLCARALFNSEVSN
jgi:hypothetical protein